MSLGYKKFSFFEKDERPEHAVPQNTTCSTSGSDQLLFGCSDGHVVVLDRSLASLINFEAHQLAVAHIRCLKRQKLAVTLGTDVASLASTTLKFWNLEGSSSRSSAAPPCLRAIKCFTAKQPEAEITALAAHEEVWPHMTLALGLANGSIYLLRGDIARDKLTRTILTLRPDTSDLWRVTGLHFRGDGSEAHLFAVTQSQTAVFDVKTQTKSVLDEMGAESGCTTLNHEGELIVGRPEAVYFYSVDGRGPCFVFEGRKQHLGWLRQYLVAVSLVPNTSGSGTPLLQVYGLRNKLIASSLALAQEPRHVVCEWGLVIVVQGDGSVLCLKEKELSHKLELLFSKNLYVVALNLARSEEADPAVMSEIQRRYGDHLYHKHDYDGAMAQYLETIGHLEPSYVIRKFLDAQRIHNLTSYLEQLHSQGKASSDHTTLLLNCYTKLKDVTKLDEFLRGTAEDADQPALAFDVETAVKVCRAAGYFEHALFVAQAAGEAQWYLDILLEDCANYDEALAYLQGLPRREAAAALKKYGKSLINHRPEATTALLMQLCSAVDPSSPETRWEASVADFAHLYTDRPQALILLCEFVLNSNRSPPSEHVLYHTLLELYLTDRSDEEANVDDGAGEAATPSAPNTGQPAEAGISSARREQALELLNKGWPLGEEPHYDADHALVVCRMHSFREGLIFLYEKTRLFREVLRVHMAADDHAALIEACVRLGDATRGGDPHLWSEVLEYFGEQTTDCTPQVLEVLGHIEAGSLLPPLVALSSLARNPRLKLSVVKDYVARQLKQESSRIEEDRRQIAKFQQHTADMRKDIQRLKTEAQVFQRNKSNLTDSPLELPAVHFLCEHSFNLRDLGENEKECPICAPQFRTILDIRRSMRAGAAEQDKFFTQLKNSADGFNVIAEFFGRGILNATSITTAHGTAG
ncbi:hypothetical protein WJX72_009074 [[Myrmecia] bisecta]|uniref:Vacuolar protein sorting-associated protein 11 homolog n=1 Tax=[Myrmecia] bisecta TaxID=41462 RepID=A0AAW1PCZ7_9CHLO